jgi:hypothetical protein
MNLLKWVLIFAFAFVVAWVLIFTFTQPPFAEGVPARIFAYHTPPIPVYIYVTGAFFIGLALGCSLALYNYITGSMKAFKLNKKVRVLETEIADLRTVNDLHTPSLPSPESHQLLKDTTDHEEGITE